MKRLGRTWEERVGQVDFIIIDKDYREYGYGTEAVEAALSFAFDELDVESVDLWTASDNEGAIRCFEKCGFKFTDVERDITADNGETYDRYKMTIERNKDDEQTGYTGRESVNSGREGNRPLRRLLENIAI